MSYMAQIAQNNILDSNNSGKMQKRVRRNSLSNGVDDQKLPPIPNMTGPKKSSGKKNMLDGRSPNTSPRSRKSNIEIGKKISVDDTGNQHFRMASNEANNSAILPNTDDSGIVNLNVMTNIVRELPYPP